MEVFKESHLENVFIYTSSVSVAVREWTSKCIAEHSVKLQAPYSNELTNRSAKLKLNPVSQN